MVSLLGTDQNYYSHSFETIKDMGDTIKEKKVRLLGCFQFVSKTMNMGPAEQRKRGL